MLWTTPPPARECHEMGAAKAPTIRRSYPCKPLRQSVSTSQNIKPKKPFNFFPPKTLLIGNSVLFTTRRRQLAALTTRHGPPAISTIREFVVAGGLMSYGASDTNAYRRAGSHYVARILKGAKPGALPVEMPTKY